MIQTFINLKQKILKLEQVHYAYEIFQKIGQHIIWKKSGLTGYVYDFIADYSTVPVDDVKDIHKYLMKKNNVV